MHSLSLKLRFTLLALLVAVIPLTIFQAISVKRSTATLLESRAQNLESRAKLIVKEVERFLRYRIKAIRMIAHSREMFYGSNQFNYLNNVQKDNPSIKNITIIDSHGYITESVPKREYIGRVAWEIKPSIKELFLNLGTSENAGISLSEAHTSYDGTEILYLAPIFKEDKKGFQFVILVETSIEEIQEIISNFAEHSIGSEQIYIVNKVGAAIVATDDISFDGSSLEDVRVQPAMLSEGKSGSVVYKRQSGVSVMAGYADVAAVGVNNALDWSVLTITPIDMISQPATETGRVLTIIGAVVSVLAVSIAYYFARSITLPLQRTVALAEEIRRGNYSHRLETAMGGEIGQLANAINEMADRVEERTAGITTRNEKLTSEIVERKKAQDRLTKLSHKIIRLQEEERRRVARELHDGINQLLVSVKYKMENVEEKINKSKDGAIDDIHKAVSLLDGAISEVRRVSHDLRPSVLDDLGLVPAIENLSRQFEERNEIVVDILGEDNEVFDRLPVDVETAMYRIVQEALMNIEKHANASKVSINLSHSENEVTIRIEDNGEGFNLQLAMRKPIATQSMGLRNMRERIELLQGTFFMHSDIGKGTFLEVTAPLII